MSRFDRRLKGANTKNSGSSITSSGSGSGASCVPQPLPSNGPLLAGMMFGGSTQRMTGNIKKTTNSISQSLDSLVSQANTKLGTSSNTINNNSTTTNIDSNTIEMLNRRLQRLENGNNNSAKTNKAYERLEKRLIDLERMYSENMENMEKYVKNQEDRINLLTNDYRKTLETLNKIIKDVNLKIVELDETSVKKPSNTEVLEEVQLEEPQKEQIIEITAKPVINDKETDDDVISEVTEEILSTVINENKEVETKNISLKVTEKEDVST